MSASPHLEILREDNHVAVVYKPAGLLSQGDLSGDLDVLTVLKAHIKERDRKSGNVYLGLVHRLDRPVAGVMAVAKTSKAAGRLSAAFREGGVIKRYRAVVQGEVQGEGAELVHRLDKDRAARITRVVSSGGKRARLEYRVLERHKGRSLVEVRLHTGLSHQIRAQLAAEGHPIVGDRKYGARDRLPEGPGFIALYSRELVFAHPVRDEEVRVVGDPPPGWIWDATR